MILKSGEYKFIDTRLKYDNLQQKRNDPNSAASRIFEQLPILERGDNFKLEQSRSCACLSAYFVGLQLEATILVYLDRHIELKL